MEPTRPQPQHPSSFTAHEASACHMFECHKRYQMPARETKIYCALWVILGQVHQFLEEPSAGRFFILPSPSGYRKSQALRSWQSVDDSHQCICLQYHLVSLSYDLVALSALIMEFMQMRYVHSKWLSLLRLWRPGIWQLNIGMRFAVE